MSDINVEEDLNTINDQISKLVEELNTLDRNRNTIVQQVQNFQGVAMYLRGKQEPVEGENDSEVAESEAATTPESIEMGSEYPEETTSVDKRASSKS
jgi:peptidoglycan hydrolase CwlO-like protein